MSGSGMYAGERPAKALEGLAVCAAACAVAAREAKRSGRLDELARHLENVVRAVENVGAEVDALTQWSEFGGEAPVSAFVDRACAAVYIVIHELVRGAVEALIADLAALGYIDEGSPLARVAVALDARARQISF